MSGKRKWLTVRIDRAYRREIVQTAYEYGLEEPDVVEMEAFEKLAQRKRRAELAKGKEA
jgi:hypothetical protein